MQRFHRLLHQGRLVHPRRAHVHIQQVRTLLRLGHRLLQNIIHIPLGQRLLEPLFAGGVDALAHHPHGVHRHAGHGGAQHRRHGMGLTARLAVPEHAAQQANEIRRGAAAAASGEQAQLPVRLHLLGEQLRRDVVTAAVGTGQARVGLDEHREIPRQGRRQPTGHRQNFLGAQRAVDAQRVRAKATSRGGKALHRAAGEGAAVGLEAHAGQHGKVTVLLHRQQGGLQLIQVGKGLHHHQIGSGCRARPDDAGEIRHGTFKGQGADGLQQLAQRADVQRRQRPEGLAGTLAAGHARRHDLLQRIDAFCQLAGRRAEGVGVDDPASGGGIHAMDPLDLLRIGDVQLLRPCAQLKARRLQHGAHAAVQQDGVRLVPQFIDLHRSSLAFDTHICPAGRSVRTLPDGPSPGGG